MTETRVPSLVLRFVGDRRGFRVAPGFEAKGWVRAEVGVTGEEVLVDADKAYLVEAGDGWWDAPYLAARK